MIHINISGDISEQILRSCLGLIRLKNSGSSLKAWQIVIHDRRQKHDLGNYLNKLMGNNDDLIELSIQLINKD